MNTMAEEIRPARKQIQRAVRSDREEQSRGINSLTPRQQEILRLLAQGSYYKEIGAELGISHATVRAHLHSVYCKLKVKSRARATAKFHEFTMHSTR